ncbi:MAG: hypothetical protein A3E79_15100 [Burkholderiales bacterium RIFCSPHIGHO2_12_FULL_61_11]|nr:MAG: hypothetical protein A3E79_15100 [Burkholderiales bacterium RIFCSPHIGHO2_12_FULL_61_11]
MSFHSPWRWTDGQLQGFQEAMQGVPTDYRVFQMNTKKNSSTEAKEKKGKEARDLIDEWKPDLVYTSDDDAQEYVAKYYVNKDTPFVFSGVNADPKLYGFTGSRNNTGVLEQEHFVESVKLLKAIVPDVKRIVAVFDDASMWDPVMKRMKEKERELPGVQFVAWDVIHTFEEFKQKIREYPGQADAIALIGIFNFKDENGKNVPYQEVLKWTAENSRLPDFSFWLDRVYYGTLCSFTVSEREQGLAAGRMARAILVEGKSPASFDMKPTVKGLPVVNLARTAKLGIKVKSGVLLSAEVVRKFEWDK